MKIIIEGPDGVGKTTVAKALAEVYGCDIIHMTEKGSKNYEDYLAKGRLKHIVSDRSFLSEAVYSIAFDRKRNLTPHEVERLLQFYRDNDWKIIVLDADTDVIVNRLKLRGDEDECKILNVKKLRAVYLTLAKFFDIPVINNEDLIMKDIIKFLEDKK